MSLNAAQKAYLRHCVASEVERKGDKKATLTDTEFAELIGVHLNTLRNWKLKPEFQTALKRGIEEFESSADYFALVLKHRMREELWSNYTKATGAERRHYLNSLMDEVKNAPEYDDSPDYDDMTDEDLASLCLKREVSPIGMSRDELVRLANKGD